MAKSKTKQQQTHREEEKTKWINHLASSLQFSFLLTPIIRFGISRGVL